jgi:hypothetical protein
LLLLVEEDFLLILAASVEEGIKTVFDFLLLPLLEVAAAFFFTLEFDFGELFLSLLAVDEDCSDFLDATKSLVVVVVDDDDIL